jgi:hypothetical protein
MSRKRGQIPRKLAASPRRSPMPSALSNATNNEFNIRAVRWLARRWGSGSISGVCGKWCLIPSLWFLLLAENVAAERHKLGR